MGDVGGRGGGGEGREVEVERGGGRRGVVVQRGGEWWRGEGVVERGGR